MKSRNIHNPYKLIFFLLILMSFSCHKSIDYHQIHGTIIVAGIVRDSILMAADSRTGIPIGPKTIGGYVDRLPKIFKIKDFLIATAGNANIGYDFVCKIIADFNKVEKQSDFHSTIIDFQTYLDENYPILNFPESETQFFIAAGFYNHNPQIIYFNRTNLKATKNDFVNKGVYSNDKSMVDYLSILKPTSFNCDSVGQMVSVAILDYAKTNNMEDFIGGPISLVKILPENRIVWIKNNFTSYQTDSYNSFLNGIKSGKFHITPLVPNGHDSVINSLMKNKYYKR